MRDYYMNTFNYIFGINNMTRYEYYYFFYLLILFFAITNLTSCGNNNSNDLPPSIEVNNNIITFFLKDEGYQRVILGSDMFGHWSMTEMEKMDSVWSYATYINRNKIEYKYFIDDTLWITDPLNPNIIELEHPFEGYNSLVVVK